MKPPRINTIPKAFLLGAIVLLTAGQPLLSQVSDAALWTSVNIEKKINQRISIGLSNEFRFNENISKLGTLYNDLGVGYRFNKNLRLSVNYRFVNKRLLDDSYSQRHRFYADLTAKKKFSPVECIVRLRFQQQYKDMYVSEDGLVPDFYFRPKLSLKYLGFNKLEPFISYEAFFPLWSVTPDIPDGHRFSVGIDYSFDRRNSIEFFGAYNLELGNPLKQTDYIAGVGYSFSF